MRGERLLARIGAMHRTDTPPTRIWSEICDSLNGHTAGQAATADTRPINVGAAQMATFLALLSGQIANAHPGRAAAARGRALLGRHP